MAGLKATPRLRPDRSVTVRFPDESAARVTDRAVTLTTAGPDKGSLARRFASGFARLAGWIDIGASPAWPFDRPPGTGEPLAIDPGSFRAAVAARLTTVKMLFLRPDPELRAAATGVLEKHYGPFAAPAGPLPKGEPILILTHGCLANLTGNPQAGLHELTGIMARQGDLAALAFKGDRPPTPIRLASLIANLSRTLASKSASERPPPLPQLERPSLAGPAGRELPASENPTGDFLDEALYAPEDNDSHRPDI